MVEIYLSWNYSLWKYQFLNFQNYLPGLNSRKIIVTEIFLYVHTKVHSIWCKLVESKWEWMRVVVSYSNCKSVFNFNFREKFMNFMWKSSFSNFIKNENHNTSKWHVTFLTAILSHTLLRNLRSPLGLLKFDENWIWAHFCN